MDPTGGFIYTCLDRVRTYTNDTDADGKYTNDFLINHCVCPAMIDVLARLNMNRSEIIRHYLSISVVAGTEFYQLPPSILEVEQLAMFDEMGNLLTDALPRSIHHPQGPGWSLEGNTLHLKPAPQQAVGLTLVYIHNGDCLPHYGSGTLSDQSGVDRVELALSPTIGQLDRRPNAYAGSILRLLPTSPGPIEERVVSSSFYSASKWYANVRVPFTYAADGAVTYEIAPIGSQSLYEAISLGAAMKLGVARRLSQATMGELRIQWRTAMKTIGDNLSNMQARTGKAFDRNVRDNDAVHDNLLFRTRTY